MTRSLWFVSLQWTHWKLAPQYHHMVRCIVILSCSAGSFSANNATPFYYTSR